MPASWRTFTHAARHCSSVPYSCSNSASVNPCMIARIDPIPCLLESILHRFRGGRKGGDWLISGFPKAPCYARFIALTHHVWVPLTVFLLTRMGRRTGIYYIDSTPLPVCHPRRINRHKVFAGLAERGKTSTGWFFGLKLHLVFNHERQIVALALTPGNVNDTTPGPQLTQGLIGKLFGDKGYVGNDLAQR